MKVSVVLLTSAIGVANALYLADPEQPDPAQTFLCIDAINKCGQMYGACYDTRKGPFEKLYPPPPCPGDPGYTPQPPLMDPPSSLVDPVPKATPPPAPFTSAPTPTKCAPRTICVDAVNKCGQKYGACYDSCKGKFKDLYPPPPCPTPTA